MADPTVSLPTYTDTVDLRWFIEPLRGATHPSSFLDHFPEEVYNKTIDSHFFRFMYTLLGPSGVGWLRKNLLDARLALEDHGLELFDLERFYGDPLRFGRILDEIYEDDPTGLLPREDWDRIKSRDEQYRSRAISFLQAARLGTSPEGMRLASKSALNHDAEIIEHYRYLFDVHSDDPLGLRRWGKTVSPQEFVVIPRQEISQTEVQTISFEAPVNAGSFVLIFNGRSTVPLAYNCSHIDVATALRAIPEIGANGVQVTGGAPPNDFVITFTDGLSNRDVPEIQAISSLLDVTASPGGDPTASLGRNIYVTTTQGGLEVTEEKVVIPPALQHNLQVALDHLRPVGSIPTFQAGQGRRRRQAWVSALATSEYTEVARYVTGQTGIEWPDVTSVHWIEKGKEKVGPRVKGDRKQQYIGFHNSTVKAYTDDALLDPDYEIATSILSKYNSEHVGNFGEVIRVMPYFKQFNVELGQDNFSKHNRHINPPPIPPSIVYTADRALADYAEPLTVGALDNDTGIQFINGIYPEDYTQLDGVPVIKYKNDQFWASRARTEGADVIEIDLGTVQAVNFIAFDAIRKPIHIDVAYDYFDQSPRRFFVPVIPEPDLPFPDDVYFDLNELNPWIHLAFHFDDGYGSPIFTRYLRITLTRREDDVIVEPRFLYNYITKVQHPWSIEMKNLRIGRNVVVA